MTVIVGGSSGTACECPMFGSREEIQSWIKESWGRRPALTVENLGWRLAAGEADIDAIASILHDRGEILLELQDSDDANAESLVVALERIADILSRLEVLERILLGGAPNGN